MSGGVMSVKQSKVAWMVSSKIGPMGREWARRVALGTVFVASAAFCAMVAAHGQSAPQHAPAPAAPATSTPAVSPPFLTTPQSSTAPPSASAPVPAPSVLQPGDMLERAPTAAAPLSEPSADSQTDRGQVAAAVPPSDLTPVGMFMSADIVVKAVMVGLMFASVLNWTIWLAKSLELWGARRRLARAHHSLSAARSLDEGASAASAASAAVRSEEHTSELQSHLNLVCRL